jgi:hypothetical protein
MRTIKFYWTQAGQKPGTGTLLGSAKQYPEGWKFHPVLPGKRDSRRFWPTWDACLPRWTGGLDATTSAYSELMP